MWTQTQGFRKGRYEKLSIVALAMLSFMIAGWEVAANAGTKNNRGETI